MKQGARRSRNVKWNESVPLSNRKRRVGRKCGAAQRLRGEIGNAMNARALRTRRRLRTCRRSRSDGWRMPDDWKDRVASSLVSLRDRPRKLLGLLRGWVRFSHLIDPLTSRIRIPPNRPSEQWMTSPATVLRLLSLVLCSHLARPSGDGQKTSTTRHLLYVLLWHHRSANPTFAR